MCSHRVVVVLCFIFTIIKTISASLSQNDLLAIFLENINAKPTANSECQAQLNQLRDSFINGEKWAWKMFDAWSKIPSGIHEGNVKDYGHFDECLNINEEMFDVKGRYCFSGIATVFPTFINLTALPDLINQINSSFIEKIQQKELIKRQSDLTSLAAPRLRASKTNEIAIEDLAEFYEYVTVSLSICIPNKCLPTDLNLPAIFVPVNDMCVTRDTFFQLDKYDIAAIAIIGGVTLVMILSTIYEYRIDAAGKKPAHKILLAYSIKSNGKILFDTTKHSNHLLCLGGLKAFSILWVILGHRYTTSMEVYASNFNEIPPIKATYYSQLIQGAQYAVDTFLILSGCLLSYLAIKPMTTFKNRIAKQNIFGKAISVTSFTFIGYFHRYLRLTPAIAMIYVYYVTLFRRIGSGPLFNFVADHQKKPCDAHWWSFFLYVENYVNTADMCIVHLWYVNVDMQIAIFSPLILWPIVLYRKKMLYVGLPILTVLASVVTFLVAYMNEIVWYTDDYYNLYYYVTHTRLAPWFIGLALGLVLRETKDKKIHINKFLNILIWCACIVAIFALIFAQRDPAYNYERVKTSIWTGLHKPAFSLCICWIVWACQNGYGGFINELLSNSILQIIGRLSFCMYLVQFVSITLEASQTKVAGYFSDVAMIRLFMSDAVISIIIATYWTLAFEAPFRTIDRLMFERKRIRKEPNDNKTVTNDKSKISDNLNNENLRDSKISIEVDEKRKSNNEISTTM